MIAAIDTVCREALTVREALRSLRLHRIATTSLPHRGHVSRHGYLKQFEGNVFYLVMGYFISYLPYALLAKALSSGIVLGVDTPIGGLVLLPAAALGQLLVMPIFLGVSGWWRFARAGSDILKPSATSLDDHLSTAVLIQQAVQQRFAEQFS